MANEQVTHIIGGGLSIEDINTRIKKEICYETLEELTDSKLPNEYKECNSVKK